jgi:hypothetical protein
VVKHEAMVVRSARVRMVARTEIDLDAREAIHTPGPDEYATALERAHRSLAVLAELKPAESRASCCRPPAARTPRSSRASSRGNLWYSERSGVAVAGAAPGHVLQRVLNSSYAASLNLTQQAQMPLTAPHGPRTRDLIIRQTLVRIQAAPLNRPGKTAEVRKKIGPAWTGAGDRWLATSSSARRRPG